MLTRQVIELHPPLAGLTAEYAWTGAFANTVDGLPYIGPIDDRGDTLVALGYGGNGITFSVIATRLISDHILGRPNGSAGLFLVNRRKPASGGFGPDHGDKIG